LTCTDEEIISRFEHLVEHLDVVLNEQADHGSN
jgi:hypothetical protein